MHVRSNHAKIGKLILKFTWKCKGTRIAKPILKKKKLGRLTLLNFKTYYRATVMKTVWSWH